MAFNNDQDTVNSQRRTYHGNWHCARIRYTVTLDYALAPEGPAKIDRCNCSICTKNGYLLVYPKREDVIFESGCDKDLKSYFFGKKEKPHRYCGECGSSVLIDFANSSFEKQRPFLAMNVSMYWWRKRAQANVQIQVRLFRDVDLDAAEYTTFDGRNRLEPAYDI